MLNWLLGGERSEDDQDLDISCEDVPDTPAPTFVVRAFKTALFGTPAPQEKPQLDFKSKENPEKRKPIALGSESEISKKPSGILLTPGTVTTLRKTVSFDKDVIENEKYSEFDEESKVPHKSSRTSLDSPTQRLNQNVRKTSLTRKLENVRLQSLGIETNFRNSGTKLGNSFLSNSDDFDPEELTESQLDISSNKNDVEKTRRVVERLEIDDQDDEDDEDDKADEDEGDTTLDLNRPHSLSGKYWKSEFENYHKEAKLEMRKLLSYKELAKSFARIKDERSINLAGKLKEEQRKVIAMEETISRLSANLQISGSGGVENVDEPRILIKELARQTARVIQYKEQVEEFRKLMEKIEPCNSGIERDVKESNFLSTGEDKSDIETKILISQMKNEIKYLSQKLQDIVFFKEENEKLRKIICEKDETISCLKYEKERLISGKSQPEVQNKSQKIMCNEEIHSRIENRNRISQKLQNSELDHKESKNLYKQKKIVKENQSTNNHESPMYKKNQIKPSIDLTENTMGLQKSLKLNEYENNLISKHYENKIQLQRSYLDLKGFVEEDLQSVIQASDPISSKKSQERHVSDLISQKIPPYNRTRPRLSASESRTHSDNHKSPNENIVEAIGNIKMQDDPVLCADLSENQNLPKISPKFSSIETYAPTSCPQNPESMRLNKKHHTVNASLELYCPKLERTLSTELNSSKMDFLRDKPVVTLNKDSSSHTTRPGNIGSKPVRSSLSEERFEAAKKRLAEKKRLSIAAKKNLAK